MSLRTLIVDDEPCSREKVRGFLADHPDFEVVAECENGKQAALAILREKPDVVFLDVQIPGQNGMELLDSMPKVDRPLVVLVTAFEQYAVRAFQQEALDYLLKPFNRARFTETVNRVRRHRLLLDRAAKTPARLVNQRMEHSGRIAIKSGSKIVFLESGVIQWIEAERDYVLIHTEGRSYLVRQTMNSMISRLDPNRFARIHRSAIVNFDFIQELQSAWSGDYRILLRNGTRLNLSRNYKSAIWHKLPPQLARQSGRREEAV